MQAGKSAGTDAAAPAVVLELDGLVQRLRDPQSGAEFVVEVDRPLRVLKGDFVAILGPSGCGKTTLLTVLGLLRQPTNPREIGVFRIRTAEGAEGIDPGFVDLKAAWCRRQQGLIERIRRSHVGFALQSGELLPSLTVAENIAAPMHLNGVPGAERRQRVMDLVDAFGLRRKTGVDHYDLSRKRVNKLSGGEYQRVSLARAIAHRPSIVFVDEPTAALNREMARGALEQFRLLEANGSGGAATIMITHDEDLAGEFANLIVRMAPVVGRPAGRITEIIRKD
ncbi:MAG: ABC transporter ATP-binding protein [Planctomycetia bacterium]